MSPILKMARQPTTLCLVLLLLGVAHGFMSSEFSSTRYFTDKGLLPPLKGRGLQPFALNQTSDTATLPYTTDTSSVLSLHGSSVPVTYTNNPKSVYRWLSDNLPYEGCTVGFDVEVSRSVRIGCTDSVFRFETSASAQDWKEGREP